jgi:hypothetical protein
LPLKNTIKTPIEHKTQIFIDFHVPKTQAKLCSKATWEQRLPNITLVKTSANILKRRIKRRKRASSGSARGSSNYDSIP